MPGTYIAGEPLVTIAAFAPTLHVINSKQRPRKLTIHGGDGAEYMFLLKVRGRGNIMLWGCECRCLALVRSRHAGSAGAELAVSCV